MSISKNSCILLRALSSASSSSRVAAPKAEDSSIPVTPEPNPLAMFSNMPESGLLDDLIREVGLSSFSFWATVARSRALNFSISARTSGELGFNPSGIPCKVYPS